jgi:hypothetical protein
VEKKVEEEEEEEEEEGGGGGGGRGGGARGVVWRKKCSLGEKSARTKRREKGSGPSRLCLIRTSV